jgi:hypothetical protein
LDFSVKSGAWEPVEIAINSGFFGRFLRFGSFAEAKRSFYGGAKVAAM